MGAALPHTVRAFDQDLEKIRALVCEMGGRVEAALTAALVVMDAADEDQVAKIIADCRRGAGMSEAVEKTALCFIALQAPRADDLQQVVIALKVAETLAAMAAGVCAIVERMEHLQAWRRSDEVRMLRQMSLVVSDMARLSLDAFARADGPSAPDLEERDDAVDALYRAVIVGLHRHMAIEPDLIASGMHLLLVARTIERLGDCAAKIARTVGSGPVPPEAYLSQLAVAGAA